MKTIGLQTRPNDSKAKEMALNIDGDAHTFVKALVEKCVAIKELMNDDIGLTMELITFKGHIFTLKHGEEMNSWEADEYEINFYPYGGNQDELIVEQVVTSNLYADRWAKSLEFNLLTLLASLEKASTIDAIKYDDGVMFLVCGGDSVKQYYHDGLDALLGCVDEVEACVVVGPNTSHEAYNSLVDNHHFITAVKKDDFPIVCNRVLSELGIEPCYI